MLKQTRIIVAVVIAVLLVIALVQNRHTVDTTILFFITVRMPLAILLLVTFLAGLAVGLLRAGYLVRKGR